MYSEAHFHIHSWHIHSHRIHPTHIHRHTCTYTQTYTQRKTLSQGLYSKRHIHILRSHPHIYTVTVPHTDKTTVHMYRLTRQACTHTLVDPPTHRRALTHAAGALVVSPAAAAVTSRSLGPLSGLCLITSCSSASSSKLELQTLSRDHLILSPASSQHHLSHLSSVSHCLFLKTCSSSLFLSLSSPGLSHPLPSHPRAGLPYLSCLFPQSVVPLAQLCHISSPTQFCFAICPHSVPSPVTWSSDSILLSPPSPHLGLWNHSWFSLGGGGARLFIGA